MATPERPRPRNFPPNHNPNALASNIQNLQINQPNQQQSSSAHRPPNTTPHQQPPTFTNSSPPRPPPRVFLRGPTSSMASAQPTFPPNMIMSSRPSGPPPSLQPGVLPPIGGPTAPSHSRSGPHPRPFPSAPPMSGPGTSPHMMSQSGPRFPSAMGGIQRPSAGPPQSANTLSPGSSSQPPQMRSNFATPSPTGSRPTTGQQQPPFSDPSQNMPRHSATSPFSTPHQQHMFGMPPGGAPPPNQSMALSQTEQSKIDLDQIPRVTPSSAVILHETRQENQANPPPPATSDFIVKDTGNCSPRYMRCTINQIPCTVDLLSTSGMQLTLLVQPLAIPHPSEEPVHIIDFGESGPVRCSRCKGYINPFIKFIDQGRCFVCNLCGFTDETPRDYHCNLGPDGRRRDADEKPELCRGTVEFVATTEYMVRDPMAALFFFLIDVSMTAIQTGATAAACSAIKQVISDLPKGPRTMVGFATFDSTIHFYNLKRASQQPLMLIIPDVQDVYTPLISDVIVRLAEHLEILLESIPSMFENTKTADSACGAALQAAFLAMKSSGGKLLVFQSTLPSTGIGSLSAREAEGRSNISAGNKEAHKLLQPIDKTLKTMAVEFAEYQVCVDLFITTQSYVDIASLSVIPRTTGGQVYYYYPFSVLSDTAKLYNDLRWNVTRPQGFEAVMRVRCSQGIRVQEYSGNFCRRVPTDVDLPVIDCDKTIMVTLKHDGKLQEGSECSFQCALLYTTIYGQRRIRVSTLSLPCTNMLSNLFRAADIDTQFACILKQAASEIPSAPLAQVRDQATNFCVKILYSYRKFCATVSSSGQLILPESLKLLPLYILALLKSTGLHPDGRIDKRSYWINHVSHLPTHLVIPLVYPRMISIHDLDEKELGDSIIPTHIPLNSEHITDGGIYLLENGEDCLIYLGNSVRTNVLQQLFGISSVEEISNQYILQEYDNSLSKKLNAIVNEIRRQRCSYLRLKFCKKGDPSGMMFFGYMVEDKSPGGLSYVEYLIHIHRQIQSKMA